MIRQALVLLLLSAGAAFGTWLWHPRAPALHMVTAPLREDEVSLTMIRGRWNGDVLWIDARPRAQFEQEHIPGARLLNEQEFDDLLFELLDVLQKNTKPVVIYCGGERCDASRKIRGLLLERFHLENVFVLQGGWKTWKADPASW